MLIALLLEVGLLLILIPWSAFWERNLFAELVPGLRDVMTNNFVRGAISGLGVVNLWAALAELADVVGARRRGASSAVGESLGDGTEHHAR